jgi:hypothetical protein
MDGRGDSSHTTLDDSGDREARVRLLNWLVLPSSGRFDEESQMCRQN